MTAPREWPNGARKARDGAAEEIAAALTNIVPLAEVEQDSEVLRKLARTINHLQNSLRHLERAGAHTLPRAL
jgi:ubiquinone biosynthesis protein UbiJ